MDNKMNHRFFNSIAPPHKPGVYFFKDFYNNILYIGKAKNLNKRISCYNTDKQIDWKIKYLLEKSNIIEWIITKNEQEALLIEAELISSQKPLFNKLLTSNNPFYYIIFENKAKPLPIITISKIIKKNTTCSIGPFLKKKDALKLFDLLLSFFNLSTCNKKISHGCLHFHIGKCCGTCKEDFNKKNYIHRIYLAETAIKNETIFFEILEKEIKKAKKNFQLSILEELITYKSEYKKIFHLFYLNQETLYEEKNIEKVLLQTNIEEITYQKIAKKLSTILSLNKDPYIIDCIDISHFQGSYVVGSSIRFDYGKYNKYISNAYILKNEKNNDYKNIILTIQNHYLNNLIPLPDILLIDGGKGQLNTVLKMNLSTKCIALAKKEEQLFFNNTHIKLNLHDDYAKLLIKIRNTAHNAAIYLHKKIRNQIK